MDSSAPRGVGRLHDPHVSLGFSLLELLVVSVEVVELVRQYVGIWDEIKLAPPESFLHLDIIEAQTVFPSDFIALREMIDPLELIQAFVEVAFARRTGPQDVPLVRISEVEVVGLEQ